MQTVATSNQCIIEIAGVAIKGTIKSVPPPGSRSTRLSHVLRFHLGDHPETMCKVNSYYLFQSHVPLASRSLN